MRRIEFDTASIKTCTNIGINTRDYITTKETTIEKIKESCRVDVFTFEILRPEDIKNYQKDRNNIELKNNETYFELYYQPYPLVRIWYGARAAYKCHKCGYNTYHLMEVDEYSECPKCGKRIIK